MVYQIIERNFVISDLTKVNRKKHITYVVYGYIFQLDVSNGSPIGPP